MTRWKISSRNLVAGSGLLLTLLAVAVLAQAPAEPAPAEPPAPATSAGANGSLPLPAPVYETRIEADYDPEDFRIEGKMRLVWRNTSSVPVGDLQFHHYLNAFANNRSTFMTGSGGQLRGDRFDEERWGWIEVSSIQIAGQGEGVGPGGPGPAAGEGAGAEGAADLGSADLALAGRELRQDGQVVRVELKDVEEFLAPDDGNLEDRTVARYQLPQPLAPGASIELEITFEAQLPTIFARTGADGEYVLAGQWFPKIAVFEDAGMRGREEAGWNAHQFHANSEFYADFGNYDVSLTLPERYQGKIGATGELVDETVADGKVTAHFVQDGVHDFAWTADPDFIVLTERFEPERDVRPEVREKVAGHLGVSEDVLALPPVEITLFLQPPHASQAGRYFRAAKEAIAGYGLRLGPYPWSTLTMVDPPHTGLGSAGMEYPTFITLGTDALLQVPPFNNVLFPEIVTIHEFGHQYFQGMSASNEFEESWLDEGVNSYYEMLVVEDGYGPEFRMAGFRRPRFETERSAVLGPGPYQDPILKPAWKYYSGGSYGAASYPRPAVTLRHLENYLGQETFHRAMRHFFETWRFRHPSTADFEQAIAESAGQDLEWFFSQALRSTRGLDYSVRRLESHKVKKEKGIFWRDGERQELGGRKDSAGEGEEGEEVAEEVAADAAESGDPETRVATADTDVPDDDAEEGADDGDDEEETVYASEVYVFREGEFIHPVTIEFTFEGGETVRETWNGEERWQRYRFTRPERLESAVVDPERLMVLEKNRLNNGRLRSGDSRPAAKISEQALFWLQNLLQLTGLLG